MMLCLSVSQIHWWNDTRGQVPSLAAEFESNNSCSCLGLSLSMEITPTKKLIFMFFCLSLLNWGRSVMPEVWKPRETKESLLLGSKPTWKNTVRLVEPTLGPNLVAVAWNRNAEIMGIKWYLICWYTDVWAIKKYVPSLLFLGKNGSPDFPDCFHTNLKICPTEEDVDVDDVLVEDAEVILLLWLSHSDYTEFSFWDDASFYFRTLPKLKVKTL